MKVKNDIRFSWMKNIFTASSEYLPNLKFKPLIKIKYMGINRISVVSVFHIIAAFVSSLSMIKSTESPANLSKRMPITNVISTDLFIFFKFKYYI